MTKAASVPAILLIAATIACSGEPAEAGPPVASGRFEQLSLAVAPDGGLTGAYREVQGEGVTKSCAFSLTGRIGKGDAAAVTVRGPGGGKAVPGRIALRPDGVVLTVPGARDFPGCGLVLMPEIDGGLDLSRTSTTRWTALRRIAVPKAVLFTGAAGAATRGYLVAGDIVGVGDGDGARSRVDYVSAEGRVTGGWVANGALASLVRTP